MREDSKFIAALFQVNIDIGIYNFVHSHFFIQTHGLMHYINHEGLEDYTNDNVPSKPYTNVWSIPIVNLLSKQLKNESCMLIVPIH